jgi:hypothetical protein
MHYWYGLITATDTNNLLLVSAALGGLIPKIRTPKNLGAGCQKNPGAGPRQDYLCLLGDTDNWAPFAFTDPK